MTTLCKLDCLVLLKCLHAPCQIYKKVNNFNKDHTIAWFLFSIVLNMLFHNTAVYV